MSDEYPAETSDAFRRYAELDARLAAAREGRADDDAVLEEMAGVWEELSRAEQEWFEYQGFRRTAAQRGDNVDRKLEQLWKGADARARARACLEDYGRSPSEREPERVRLAALRLCEGSVELLVELVKTAKQDYRGIVTRAERPAEEYWAWIRQ
jgi:hypothetical protein